MGEFNYWDEYPSAVTICDKQGVIVYMNQKSVKTFEKYGGGKLIGQSLFTCHNPHSVTVIKGLIAHAKCNTYTIQKDGKKNSFTSRHGSGTGRLPVWLK
jgi:DUF438 domain-containing protein